MKSIKVKFTVSVPDDFRDTILIHEIIKAVDVASKGLYGSISEITIEDADLVTINIERKEFWNMIDSIEALERRFIEKV